MHHTAYTQKARLGPLYWTVPSATTKGVTYEVAADAVTGELRCNCLARVTCWHIKACASGAMGKPRVRYQPSRPITPADVADLYAA